MIYLAATLAITILVSAFCSMLEAMVLSTTPLEIESLKKRSKKRGEILEKSVLHIEKTTSAILTLNTVANTFGATLSGVLYADIYGTTVGSKYVFPALLTVGILVFAEILPKNIGVLYRPSLQPHLVYPLHWVRTLMSPVSAFFGALISMLTSRKNVRNSSDDEIIMLAEKGAKDGLLTLEEKTLILNALTLDDLEISSIMTPRTVLKALDEDMTVAQAFAENSAFSFGRMPAYKGTIDNITGIIRRRDLLLAKANDKDSMKIGELLQPAVFVPENGSALSILRQLIKAHQHIGIVVDEFGSLTGVITLEDIFENLLGSEIFETDDVAVDMRELARRKKFIETKKFIESKKRENKK